MTQASLKEIVARAKEIYARKYQKQFEEQLSGKYVAIDVESEEAYVGDTEMEAFENAKAAFPDRLFHLIKIGEPNAFRMRFSPRVVSIQTL